MTVQRENPRRLHVFVPNSRPATACHVRRPSALCHPRTPAAPDQPPAGAAGPAGPIDWAPFGVVVPVLGGSPGDGASVVAAAISDVAQLAGLRTLLVDAADPVRSGLAMAARNAGPWIRGPHPAVSIRYSWRAQAILAQLETWLPTLPPELVPPPRFFNPGANPHVTIVDIGHDVWRMAANPLLGPGEWFRSGSPMPAPLLVVRATRPSLVHAEQMLTRLEPWISAGTMAAPVRLVVVGARRWPPGVIGSAGRRLAALLPRAIFVPHDRQTAVDGVSPELTAASLRRAIGPILQCLAQNGGRA